MIMSIAPVRSGKKVRPKKAREEWCPCTSWIHDQSTRDDIERVGGWNGIRDQFTGLDRRGLHPKTQRRYRREITRRVNTHVRCPQCGRRLLIHWATDDSELIPQIPRHKIKR